MRAGTRLGVDVGTVRVGVAKSDPAGIVATPLETVPRNTKTQSDIERIADLVREWDVLEIVIGHPRSLSGVEGPAAHAAVAYAGAVARRLAPVPVRLVDERLSTVTAQRSLREAGVRGRKARPVVDQVAAVVILQEALDTERTSGRPPGALVAPKWGPGRSGPQR